MKSDWPVNLSHEMEMPPGDAIFGESAANVYNESSITRSSGL
jgi:hypothetical protein